MSNNLVTMSTTKKENTAPEKYPVRSGTIDAGKEYEINNITLLALKCCFEDLEDFWMASNVDGCGELDDVVMFKKRKDSDQGVTYLIQLKHQVAAKPIVTKMFLNETGDYSFVKYSKCYSELQKKIETETKNTILAHLKQNYEILFIIFTNKSVTNTEEYTDKSVTRNPATGGFSTQTNLLQTDLTDKSATNSFLQRSQLHTNLLQTIKSRTDLSTDRSVTDKLQEISRLHESLLQISQLQTSLLQTFLLHIRLIEQPTMDKRVTDRAARLPKFLIKIQKPSPILDDIGCDGEIFKIDYEVLAAELTINVEFLKKLYVFTNQLPNGLMEVKIKSTLIEKLGNKLQLSDEDISDIVTKFVKFIEQWAKGALGGHYALTKEIILKKLVELLLFRYKLTVQTEENDERMGEEDIEEVDDIWYEITKETDVTVIDDADDVVRRYIRNVTNKIICNESILNSITKINKRFMRVVKNCKNLSKFEKYELLWKTGKIPLILEVSDDGDVRNIQEILNQFPKVFKIIILNKTKIHFEEFGDLNLFVNLNDLRTEHQEYILRKPITFQGREGACIDKLNINSKLFKVKDVVDILCGQFIVGRKFDDVPKFFIEMSLTTHIFDIGLLKSSEDIFVVRCGIDDFESVLQNQLGIDAKQIIHWKKLNQSDFNGQIIVFDDIKNLEEIDAFCLTLTKPVHFLLWHGGDHADLIKSNNINENLKNHKRTSTKPILITDLLRNFYENKQTLIISAIPGMGKSVLMNYFALNMPVRLWVLHIPLAKYHDHYRNWGGHNCDSQQLNFERFWKEVVIAQQTTNAAIFNSVFEQYLNCRNVVFLLDGLDEVPVHRQHGAMQLIQFINQSGYYTCVTTRPLLQEKLESTLNTFAITLNMFTKDQQTSYLRNYFVAVSKVMPSNGKVEEFVGKLLEATKSNLNDFDHQFTGVPLQTTLLAEVFEKDFLKYQDEEIFKNETFDLIYLYEHFIKKKIKIACTKVENVSEAVIHCFKECRSLYGLRHLFDEQILQDLKIDEQLTVTKKLLPHALQQIQKDGITVIDSDSNVTFVHQTYAEYLAANWLAENRMKQKEVVRKLVIKCFNSNFVVVRNMFDRILAKNCPLHTAIMNRQFDTVQKLILDENAFDVRDHGGRTIAHLLSAWELRTVFSNNVAVLIMDKIKFSNTMLKNKLRHVEDELLHYTVLDYAILNRSLEIANSLTCTIHNLSCNINLSKEETDSILDRVKCDYGVLMYIIILKCFIRTSCNEHEVKDILKRSRHGDLYEVWSRISEQNVDDADSEGRTLLHAATKSGHKETVQFLLTMKADVNKTDNNGRSALHWASYLGHTEIISMLLVHGAQPNATDCYNLTTYHYAILSSLENQTEIVSLLLSRNRTIATQKFNAIDYLNYRYYKVHPVYLADLESQKDVVNLILFHTVDANIKGFRGITALMFAARNDDIDSIKLLLENNADVNAVDDCNETALHYAARKGDEKVLTILLTNNADANARNSDNITPLHLAAQWANKLALTILLPHVADVNARDCDNYTPLHLAAKFDRKDAATILLTHGADVNTRDRHNCTPLHWAANCDGRDVVTILLKHRANVNARDSYNETPLDIAVREDYQDIVTILTNAKSKYKPHHHL